MTIAEINRAIASKERQDRIKSQERAFMDYKLANLIAVFLGNDNPPAFLKYYSFLFEEEVADAIEQEQRTAESEAAFINFAAAFNQKFHSENTAKEVVDE